MKTQTSHTTPSDNPGYSGVYQQQGRMITDADWNALTDIEKQRLVSVLRDAIASGAPGQGGLAIKNGGDDPLIEPGILYVDGVPARLRGENGKPIPLSGQPDCPALPKLENRGGQPVTLFADVWELGVTALDDPELMDPALHGADTTTRTRTLVQVKWIPGERETLPDALPERGSAPLTLTLRKIVVGDDPCDPCASEMNLDERIGNYLFRVEVHDVFIKDAQRHLVLKWSRDNGAEAHEVEHTPPGFNQGHWVWEFYDADSEKTAGLYFPADHPVQRGVLKTEFTVPGASEGPHHFVRQWDGYLVLNLDTQTLEEGQDRGTKLHTSGSSDAHGWVGLDSGQLTLNSELLEFQLTHKDQQFLPGDYWQAAVRETVHNSGDRVLGSAGEGEAPLGVRHRYLILGHLNADGTLVEHDDAERRRFAFPPLTDLKASDVGFTQQCKNLYHNAENVQQALDALCDIGAEDIAYRLPDACEAQNLTPRELLEKVAGDQWPQNKTTVENLLDTLLCHFNSDALPHTLKDCKREEGPSYRELLKLEQKHQPTSDVLNQILCETTAQRIPLDREAELCEELKRAEAQTVQEALNVLCWRDTGGGCARVVEPGQLEGVLRDVMASNAEHIWLCLKPGEHPITGDIPVTAKKLIRITGAGYHASQIRLTINGWGLKAPEFYMGDLSIQFGDNVQGTVELDGYDVTMERVQIQSFEQQNEQPMLRIFNSDRQGLNSLCLNNSRLLPKSGTALFLEHVSQRALIQNNYINGEVHYSHSINKQVDPHTQNITSNRTEGDRVEGSNGAFIIENNTVQRWVSLMESGLVRRGALARPVSGPVTLAVNQNSLGVGSSFIGQRLNAYGNQLFGASGNDQPETAVWLIANQLIATGHMGDPPSLVGRFSAFRHSMDNNLLDFKQL